MHHISFLIFVLIVKFQCNLNTVQNNFFLFISTFIVLYTCVMLYIQKINNMQGTHNANLVLPSNKNFKQKARFEENGQGVNPPPPDAISPF